MTARTLSGGISAPVPSQPNSVSATAQRRPSGWAAPPTSSATSPLIPRSGQVRAGSGPEFSTGAILGRKEPFSRTPGDLLLTAATDPQPAASKNAATAGAAATRTPHRDVMRSSVPDGRGPVSTEYPLPANAPAGPVGYRGSVSLILKV